jgi:hypothetical protein
MLRCGFAGTINIAEGDVYKNAKHLCYKDIE